MAPANYNILPYQNKKDKPEGPSNRTAKPKQQTNELRDKPTFNRKRREGVKVAGVCVLSGRQSSAILSLLSKQTCCEAYKKKHKKREAERADRDKQHKEAQNTHKKRPSQKEGGKPTTPNRIEGSEADRTKGRKGARGKKASGGQKRKERTPGKAAGAGGRKPHRPRRARAPLAVSYGVLDHTRANTSVQERGAPKQHPQHGVEGKAPHRAEAFVVMRRSEDRSQSVTTRHTKNIWQPGRRRYNQIPGGRDQQSTDWTRRRGPTKGGGEGGDKARREQARPQQPQTPRAKKSKTTKQETQNNRNKRKEPRSTPKGELQGKRRGQRTPDTKGQPKQAAAVVSCPSQDRA